MLDESKLAEDLYKRMKNNFVNNGGQWLQWDGYLYSPVTVGEVGDFISDFLGEQPPLFQPKGNRPPNYGKLRTISFMDTMRKRMSEKLYSTDMDTNPDYLHLGSRVYNVKTRTLTKPNPALHRISRKVGAYFDKHAKCPEFIKFMRQLFPSPEMCHYALTALSRGLAPSGKDIFVCHGPPDTGKSTLFRVMEHVLGSYYVPVSKGVAVKQYGTVHDSHMHALKGARMGVIHEPPKGSKMHDSNLKQLSGGDPITSHKMRGDPETWFPQITLFIMCNDIPQFQGEEGLENRLRILPFTEVIDKRKQDYRLDERLMKEASGILTLLLKYHGKNLVLPAESKLKMRETLDQQNPTFEFIEDLLEDGIMTKGRPTGLKDRIERDALYRLYLNWATNTPYKLSRRKFVSELSNLGYVSKSSNNIYYIYGLREGTCI